MNTRKIDDVMEEVKEMREEMIAFADKYDLSKMHVLASYKSIADQTGLGARESLDLLIDSLSDTAQRMAFKANCVGTIPDMFLDAFDDFVKRSDDSSTIHKI